MLLRAQVRGLLAGLTKEKGTTAIDSAYSVYTSHWGSAPEQAVVKKTVADIESDFLFLVPTQIALQLHANNSRSAPIGPTTRFYVSSWWQSVVFFYVILFFAAEQIIQFYHL